MPPLPRKKKVFDLGNIAELKEIGHERETAAELADVELWLKEAKKTRTLSHYGSKWDSVQEYFEDHGVEDDDLHLWRSYRSLISQRKMGIYNEVLKLTDILAQDFYLTFFNQENIKGSLRRYATDALPLTFLGHSEDYYYTYTHAHEHPIALISIPRRGTTSVWNWLALPHEVGHNIFDNVIGYERELSKKVRKVLSANRFTIPGSRLPYGLKKTAIMEIIWNFWLDETMADVIGTLFSGPAYVMARQEDACDIAPEIGGANITPWDVKGMDMMKHPVCHFRVIMCMEVLKRIGFASDAVVLSRRWMSMHPKITEYIWIDPAANYRELFRIPRTELARAMNITMDVILNSKLRILNNHSLLEILNYTQDEHRMILDIQKELTKKKPAISSKARPRMILAATRYAFERDYSKADLIQKNAEDWILKLGTRIKPIWHENIGKKKTKPSKKK